jgi:hypothetical protein
MMLLNTIMEFVCRMATVFRLICREQRIILNWPPIKELLLFNANMSLQIFSKLRRTSDSRMSKTRSLLCCGMADEL